MLERTTGRGREAQEWQMYLHQSSYSIHPPRLLNSSERLGKRCELFYNEKLDLDLCIWELFFVMYRQCGTCDIAGLLVIHALVQRRKKKSSFSSLGTLPSLLPGTLVL